MVRIAQAILPQASRILSDALVVVLLGWLFLSTIAGERASAGSTISKIQSDVAHYIGSSATSGALGALANLVVLVAVGVDFPLIWCVLYFFLNFIPSIGFVFAMVPPSCLALVMLGWKKALLVVAGFAMTQLVSAYAITPMLLKKRGVGVSFMEMMLSVSCWGFLLGPTGSLLAIPLTLAMKRLIPAFFSEHVVAAAPSS
jgi:predicted PurR-regulated permease PerM